MPTVHRAPEVDQDLGTIVDHIAEDNLPAAMAWLDETEALFRLLASQPEMGQLRQTRRFKRSRRHAHGNYVIYYRPVADGVQILRVIHGARDQGKLV
jgi:toxin ParE1/3/4